MKNSNCTIDLATAGASRAYASTTCVRGWANGFFTTDPTVMGTKPHHPRPKETSPPT